MIIAVDQWPKRHLINVAEYHRMSEVGLLAPDARVELIEGQVIDMAPIGSAHAGVVNYLTRFLVGAIADRAVVSVQQPVRLDFRSEPQPDVALLKPRPDLYRKSHPTPAEVYLLIEVKRLYAGFRSWAQNIAIRQAWHSRTLGHRSRRQTSALHARACW